MKFPPGLLDEIRSRLPVSAVVGRRVKLQKAGKEWRGLSPFNAEKSPSFFVNDQKAFYHDFSSGKHGDIFTFVMETEGLSFPEAVERLASEAGVTLPKISREAEAEEARRKDLHDVMALAQAFFEAQMRTGAGSAARAYCDNRGLTAQVRADFGIGYAPPDRFALRDHLAAKGIESAMMIEAGLLISGAEIAVPYDRFRDRVMFPIADMKGRVIAFGGRAMAKDAQAKYLNSPETPLFHKGRVLFNHHRARKASHDSGRIIAVEGYVDVIGMSLVGVREAVAPLGTALTEDQLALLWRMADEPILCFDGDKAGRRAAFRAVDIALPQLEAGRSLRFALLPEGQDPDDLARAGGRPAIESVLASARPLVDMLWTREVEAGPLDTPERRAALEKRLKTLLQSIRDEDLRKHYRAEIETRLAALMPAPAARQGYNRRNEPQSGFSPRRGYRDQPQQSLPLRASESLLRSALFSRTAATAVTPREALILLMMVEHPALFRHHAETLAELEWKHRDASDLAAALLDLAASGETTDDLKAILIAQGHGTLLDRVEQALSPGDRMVLREGKPGLAPDDFLRQSLALHKRALTLNTELRSAERALAEDASDANLAWVREISEQIQALEGIEADIDRLRPGG
ncbi:DNA primase [Rhizobiales bacterium TNE-4]|nr:DNA primase [Rhizobiales bacterium TNE-4]MBV1827726.1 DNA primase [Rhizobiales bacterium TNE-4]